MVLLFAVQSLFLVSSWLLHSRYPGGFLGGCFQMFRTGHGCSFWNRRSSSWTRTRTSHSSTSHSRKLKRSVHERELGQPIFQHLIRLNWKGQLHWGQTRETEMREVGGDGGGGWGWRQTKSKLKNYSLQPFISFWYVCGEWVLDNCC